MKDATENKRRFEPTQLCNPRVRSTVNGHDGREDENVLDRVLGQLLG